jgi:hypothetical protein
MSNRNRWRVAVAAGLALLMAGTALAQSGLGSGSRPKRPDTCFNAPEVEAVAIVRAGMVIRDHARACARRGHDRSLINLWAEFDNANAEEMKRAVEVRAEAFRRNWPDDPNAAQRDANETVASRHLVDFPPAECFALRDLVEGFTTWQDYMKHVRTVEVGQVKTLYRTCPRRSPGEPGARLD